MHVHVVFSPLYSVEWSMMGSLIQLEEYPGKGVQGYTMWLFMQLYCINFVIC